MEAIYFDSPAAWRDWLQAHAGSAAECFVGFHKTHTGTPSLSWSESVDEALCVGWIDGRRQRVDEARYRIRFTPRRLGSIWSAVNLAKMELLLQQGRVQPAGLAAWQQRRPEREKVYAYEQAETATLTPAELKAFGAAALAYFDASPPGYRKTCLHWVTQAKQAATRARRLQQLMDACASGERLA